VSACCIGLFSIEHVELGATLILDALAKTALEHQHGAGLGRVLRRECVEVRASCYMTAVCAVVGGSDQSLNIFALPLYRRGGSTEKSPKQAARVIYILQQARSPRNRLQGASAWTGTGCNSAFWEQRVRVVCWLIWPRLQEVQKARRSSAFLCRDLGKFFCLHVHVFCWRIQCMSELVAV
jgi:hypothetical protein